jgi:hypothetical protein
MENTPSRIAGDIVIAALAAGSFYKKDPGTTGAQIATVFKAVHAAVLAAAIEDNKAGQSNPSK